jgi:hypothetical protein
MPWSIADTIYDNTHTWRNANDRVEFEHAFKQDATQQRLMAQATMTADPAYPESAIRMNMTAGLPADAGPARPQPTIETVIDGSALQAGHLYDRAPTDFSGTPAGMESSSTPAIGAW